jgi:ABC-2 type transport system permease protein
VLLVAAAPVYGVPTIEDPVQVAAGVLIGSVGFVSLGVLLGTLLPSARSAQAVGLMLFFPSFLLGVGGPPPAVMSEPLAEIADKLPLAMVNDVVRQGWLGLGDAYGTLATVGVLAIVATALAARRTAL